jgi:hypothetical protein
MMLVLYESIYGWLLRHGGGDGAVHQLKLINSST